MTADPIVLAAGARADAPLTIARRGEHAARHERARRPRPEDGGRRLAAEGRREGRGRRPEAARRPAQRRRHRRRHARGRHGVRLDRPQLLAPVARRGRASSAAATVSIGGFDYTWPDVPAGANDDYLADGTRIALPNATGAIRVGLLGSAANGPSKTTATRDLQRRQHVAGAGPVRRLDARRRRLAAVGRQPPRGDDRPAHDQHRHRERQDVPVLGGDRRRRRARRPSR